MIKLLCSDIFISLPTFIIAECVLIYLDPDSTRAVVGWASQAFKTAVFFLYEQVTVFLVVTSLLFCWFCGRLGLCLIWFFVNRYTQMMLLGSKWSEIWRYGYCFFFFFWILITEGNFDILIGKFSHTQELI